MELFLQEVMPTEYQNVIERVNSRIDKEMKYFVQTLESNLVKSGRCLICTLKIPCKHSSQLEVDKKVDKKKEIKESYWKIHARDSSLPVASLEKLEKIERFREVRISQDIQVLKKLKQDEEETRLHSINAEKKRIRYAKSQKRKLEEYKSELREIRKKVMLKQEEKEQNKRMNEQKFKDYLVMQKRRIDEKADQNKCSIGFFKVK